jgi:hypothetical protein
MNRTAFTAELQELFLEELRKMPNVSAAARACGVAPAAAYNLRKVDASFAEAWDAALEEAYDTLEAEAHRRAFEGVTKPIHYKGVKVDTVREYSDTLLMFLLKGRRRKVFGDKSQLELTGANGGPVQLTDVEKGKRLAQLLDLAQDIKSLVE